MAKNEKPANDQQDKPDKRDAKPPKIRLSFTERLDRYLNGPAGKHIGLALVLNTALAQLFFNSAGTILPDKKWQAGILFASAAFSTVAFSLFEFVQMRRINNMAHSGITYSRWDWTQNIATQVVITTFNMYALALFNYALWPSADKPVHLHGLPGPNEIPAVDWAHAFFFSLILSLSSFVGEKKQTVEEKVNTVTDNTLSKLLTDGEIEANALIGGQLGSARAITALAALGTPKAKKFFGTLYGVMTGAIVMGDVTDNAPVARQESQEPISSPEKAKDTAEPTEATPAPLQAQGERSDERKETEAGEERPFVAPFDVTQVSEKESKAEPPRPSDFNAYSAPLIRFVLPDGMNLSTEDTLVNMAKRLGAGSGPLSEAFARSGLTPYPRRDNQPYNVKNLQVWQVLALVYCEWIALPTNVKERELASV